MTSAKARLTAFMRVHSRAIDLDFQGADLSGADFSGLCADRLNLRAVDLRGAIFADARLRGCRLPGALAADSDWSRATLRMCTLDGAHGADACFDGARLEDSTAAGADLSSASLRGAHVSETSFARALMRGAVLDNATGEGVSFRGADLAGATFIGARLDDADFRGADLRGANLSHGRFRGADFRGALLDHVTFDRADYAGALFDDGARPHPANARESAPDAKSFDGAAAHALRELVTALPGAVAERQGLTADLVGQVQVAVDALEDSVTRAPEEWKAWVDRLLTIVRGQGSLDPDNLLNALRDAPVQGSAAAVEHLRETFAALDGASDGPPDEWKPHLEDLMKMVNGERPLDPAAFIDALASLAARAPAHRA